MRGGKSSTIVPGKLEHIVVIFEENRTPDDLFHDPALIAEGADKIAISCAKGVTGCPPANPQFR